MTWKNLRAIAAAAMLATGLIGFVVGQWASADPSGPPRKPAAVADGIEPAAQAQPVREAQADDAKPAPGRRREAVIRMPVGTFVKEFEAPPYGSGRIIWEYQEDRVLGRIEASVMGVEVELATEAEISLSANGTIYGILNAVKLTHVRLPETEDFAELKPFAGLWPLVEPLVAELTTDLPFSYQFRVSGDRLSIHNFRMLLAGPNPLGKVAIAHEGLGEVVGLLMYFQALGVAVEGSYTAADAKEKEAPKARPAFKSPVGRAAPPAYFRSPAGGAAPSTTLPPAGSAAPVVPENLPVAPLPPGPAPAVAEPYPPPAKEAPKARPMTKKPSAPAAKGDK